MKTFNWLLLQNVQNKLYSVNGYPHQVWRGDALAGAGVGCVKVVMDNINIMLCVTHLHAAYPRDDVRSQIRIMKVNNYLFSVLD